MISGNKNRLYIEFYYLPLIETYGVFVSKRKLLKAHERTFYINMLFSNAPAACSQRIKGTSLSKISAGPLEHHAWPDGKQLSCVLQ